VDFLHIHKWLGFQSALLKPDKNPWLVSEESNAVCSKWTTNQCSCTEIQSQEWLALKRWQGVRSRQQTTHTIY